MTAVRGSIFRCRLVVSFRLPLPPGARPIEAARLHGSALIAIGDRSPIGEGTRTTTGSRTTTTRVTPVGTRPKAHDRARTGFVSSGEKKKVGDSMPGKRATVGPEARFARQRDGIPAVGDPELRE